MIEVRFSIDFGFCEKKFLVEGNEVESIWITADFPDFFEDYKGKERA